MRLNLNSLTLTVTLAAILLAFAIAPAASRADACTAPVTNPVACENTKAGAPYESWQIDGAGDDALQGFPTQMSVTPGSTVNFKINAPAGYHLDILRLGYYGGDGARLIQGGVTPTNTTSQPPCYVSNNQTGLVDCGTWHTSASYTVPSTAVSGVYIAHVVRNGTVGTAGNRVGSHIIFVVRDDSSHSDVVFQTSDPTWQAYNTYGGNSLYQCTLDCPDGWPLAYKAADKVSYNRPLNVAEDDSGRSSLFYGAEYPMIRFLERNGYNVSYLSGLDTASRGSLVRNHKLFLSVGHDEYWSATQRASIEAARDAGVNLAFLSGNEGFWKTRLEPSADGSNTADRTVVSYKDTHYDSPQDPVTWTGTYADPRFTSPSVNTPQNSLTGQLFVVNSGTAAITVPQAQGKLRMWKNTAAASLGSNGSLQLADQSLGYEWDVDADNGYRPAGAFQVSSTTVDSVESFMDYGSTTKTGQEVTHNMTMYKAPSGARVWGAGTVQWSWGLNDDNQGGIPEDLNMIQATMNVFADMSAQPSSRQAGTVAPTKTTDTTAPTATLAATPATVADGTKVTLSGTATDAGGLVAGIEVSVDGGTSWHPAKGQSSWTYSWIAHGYPSVRVKVRATDDSGNTQTPGAGNVINVTCPCTMFGNNVTPGPDEVDSQDPTPLELGVKFKSDVFGTVTGLRFYKASTSTGTHTGSIWSADGTRLATATFIGESSSGWQTVTFSTPVQVLPDTTYVASYWDPNGHYSATSAYFFPGPAPLPQGGGLAMPGPLRPVVNKDGVENGVYAYTGASSFPTSSFNASNYWVEPVFTPSAVPGQVTGVTATAAGSTKASVSWTAPSSGGPATTYTITPYVGTTAKTPTTVTGSPLPTAATVSGLTTGTSYKFTVTASNPTGSGTASAQSNAITPAGPVVPSAPTGVTAISATGQAQVSWTVPLSDGDSPITGYTVTPYIGATAQTPVSVSGSSTTKTVTGLANGSAYTFKVTATNAAGTSPASAASAAVTPEATIYDFATPSIIDGDDATSVELGTKFTSDVGGIVRGIRFYKAPTNTGTHVGTLWSAAGASLRTVTFSGESASGWQSATFSSPLTITAGTTYVVSYHAPNGHYSVTPQGLANGVDNAPLHALAGNTTPNGVYAYSAGSSFPNATWNSGDYGVDVLFEPPGAPGTPTGVTATAGQSSATVSWTAPSTGGSVTSYKVTPYIGATAQTATTITGTPPATTKLITGLTVGTAYTFKVTAINTSGPGPDSAASAAVTPTGAVAPDAPTSVTAQGDSDSAVVRWTAPASDGGSAITGYTITATASGGGTSTASATAGATGVRVTGLTNNTSYTFQVKATNSVGTGADSAATSAVTPRASLFGLTTPPNIESDDTGSVNLGVKFFADASGTITGLRFYKASTNTGTHVGTLWSATGTALAQGTFSNESASGWQTVTFSSPVNVTAGTTYLASYLAPNGHYSYASAAFSGGPFDNAPLHALDNGTSGNGVYAYSAGTVFPASSWNATNYWVDVLYAPGS
jgi:hypothetical protein